MFKSCCQGFHVPSPKFNISCTSTSIQTCHNVDIRPYPTTFFPSLWMQWTSCQMRTCNRCSEMCTSLKATSIELKPSKRDGRILRLYGKPKSDSGCADSWPYESGFTSSGNQFEFPADDATVTSHQAPPAVFSKPCPLPLINENFNWMWHRPLLLLQSPVVALPAARAWQRLCPRSAADA